MDAIEIQYALDGKTFKMMRLAYFPDHTPLMVGLVAASPDGPGFQANFEHFNIRHLPDQRRLDWLARNT